MHFEFKSTFNKSSRYIRSHWNTILDLILRKDYSVWISVFNIGGFVITGWLYLENYLIPASYGSGPNGDFWVSVLTAAGYLWVMSTFYCLLRMTFLSFISVRLQAKVITLYRGAAIAFRESVYIIAFQCFMFFNVFVNGPKSRRHRLAFALRPATHHNFIIIK